MRRGNHIAYVVGVLAVLFPLRGWSAETKKAGSGEAVEMFAAVDSGEVGVRFIPRNDREGRLIITNKTQRPLNVKLPDTFVGAPVLAQFPIRNNNNRNPNPNNNNNPNANNAQAPQALGTMPLLNSGNRINGNNNNNRQGNNIFSIPPEKVIEVRLETVCLEHGKRNPRPSYAYEVKPLESYTSRPALIELFKVLAEDATSRRSAQAAAWHLANDMTWEQLAAKRIKHLNAASEPYFSKKELEAAKKVAATAEKRASDAQEKTKQASISVDTLR